MSQAAPLIHVAVRYSRHSRERVWHDTLTDAGQDGPEEAAELVRRFAESTGVSPRLVRLRVLPARPGGTQAEISPVSGQSLASWLERFCREDNGVFQLRALFNSASSEAFVQVRVAFPGTATCTAGSSSESETPPMLIEQFECEALSTVASLKNMIKARTNFPVNPAVLLLGYRRLHDQLLMGRVAAAADAAGTPLQLHLAAGGAYTFLRREGQGHRKPAGPCTLSLSLPPSVQGAKQRPVPFDPSQQLSDLRWSIQAVCGLAPAGMKLALEAPIVRSFSCEDDSKSLQALGFEDGCALKVSLDWAEEALQGDAFDMPLDVPAQGSAESLYDCAGAKLGLPNPAQLVLFVGNAKIDRSADLSSAPLADGAVVSAYISWPLQVPVSVLVPSPPGAAGNEHFFSTASSSSSSGPAGEVFMGPAAIPIHSCSTVAEVRERLAATAAEGGHGEAAARLRGSRVFALDKEVWFARGSDVSSLCALERLLGHFTPCKDSFRLSRLGLADGSGHLVFVPERTIHLEVEIHHGGEVLGERKLRVPNTCRLRELTAILYRHLREKPLADTPKLGAFGHCQWSLRGTADSSTSAPSSEVSPGTSTASTVAAMVGTAAAVVAKGKRKSFGALPLEPLEKKKRFGPASELQDSEFIGDLYMKHPVERNELPGHFLCPITYDVMRDPVVVAGSGNTYDRKSIEKHFQQRHSDPLSNVELRRIADRKLVPNNTLKSQIHEAETSQVDLRLAAFLGGPQRGAGAGEGPMAAYLGWTLNLLRGAN